MEEIEIFCSKNRRSSTEENVKLFLENEDYFPFDHVDTIDLGHVHIEPRDVTSPLYKDEYNVPLYKDQ